MQQLADWCTGARTTICLLRDVCWFSADLLPHGINSAMMEWVKILGVHIAEDLSWAPTPADWPIAQQCLNFLWLLKKVSLLLSILTTFYRGTIKIILTQCITLWYENCHDNNCKALQRVPWTVELITGTTLPFLQDVFTSWCILKTTCIVPESSHLFHLEGSASSRAGLPNCVIVSSPEQSSSWIPCCLDPPWNPFSTTCCHL